MGKSKTKNEPWKPLQPAILKGAQATQDVFDANQPKLQDMSNEAYSAFKGISPEAFQTSPFVQDAQASANAIGTGGLLGANPGQRTYNRLQNPGMGAASGGLMRSGGGGNGDPSMGLLSGMATQNAGASALAAGGSNPATGLAKGVAGGKYLNNQPSADMYSGMMDASYSTSNPFLEDMIRQTGEDVRTNTNRMFASRGMGSGISSAFADLMSKNLADSSNSLRYQNYNDAENRRLQAAGQSDSVWSGERGRMDASTGLLSQDYNSAQGRALQAAQGDQQAKLAAAQALGGQYNQGQDRALEAARASDAAQQSQVQQMLTALGLTGELRNAEYAGVAPALSLLNTAADIPYVGTAALNGQIRQASNGYGTTTTSGGLGQQLLGAGAQMGSAAILASDRRLKTNIEAVGALEDGLGVYDYDYIDPARFGEGRQRGVMADEVAELRPWALGPLIDGEFASVDYGAL